MTVEEHLEREWKKGYDEGFNLGFNLVKQELLSILKKGEAEGLPVEETIKRIDDLLASGKLPEKES